MEKLHFFLETTEIIPFLICIRCLYDQNQSSQKSEQSPAYSNIKARDISWDLPDAQSWNPPPEAVRSDLLDHRWTENTRNELRPSKELSRRLGCRRREWIHAHTCLMIPVCPLWLHLSPCFSTSPQLIRPGPSWHGERRSSGLWAPAMSSPLD